MHRSRPFPPARPRDVHRAAYALPAGVPALQIDPRRVGRLALGTFLLGVALAAPLTWSFAAPAAEPGRALVASGHGRSADEAAEAIVQRAAVALADPGAAGRELARVLVAEIDALAEAAALAGLRAALAAHAAGR